jgi:DNA primase
MPEDTMDDRASKERAAILEMNKEAARFFYNCLMSDIGKGALEYLTKRGLSPVTIKKYGLGFAPDGWDNLYKHLRAKGYSEYLMYKAALITKTRKENYIDQFRNRVMFPIMDLRGNVVAFGGRDLGDRGPKYLNSAETPVYRKSKILYALNTAKNNKDSRIILTEGYMDTLSVHQAGFTEAVATCGTSLTSEQAREISKYASEVIIAYDSDGPGQAATQRATGLLKEVGLSVKVLKITDAKDPDEYIKKFGAKRFELLLNGSDSAYDHALSVVKAKYDIETEAGRVGYLKEAVEVLASIPHSLERDVYSGKVAKEASVAKETVIATVEGIIKRKRRSFEEKKWNEEKSGIKYRTDKINPQKADKLSQSVCEEKLIGAMVKNQDYIPKIMEKLPSDKVATDFHKAVFQKIYELYSGGYDVSISALGAYFSSEQLAKIVLYVSETADVNISLEDALKYADILLRSRPSDEAIKEMSMEETLKYIEELKKNKK